jgi:O-antigen ligase
MKIMNKNKRIILLEILLISMCFQNIEIINFGTFGLKLFHIIGVLFLPLLIKNIKKIKFPSKNFTFFLIFMIIVSTINVTKIGFHSLILNYIFSYYLLILLYTFANDIKRDEWEKIIQNVASFALFCVYVNAFVHRNIIIRFLSNPFGHPVYKFIFGGGANLEATWIGMFGFFFNNKNKGYLYILLCTFISAMLASRVGIIIDVIVFLFLTFSKNDKNKIDSKKIIIGILVILVTVLIAQKTGVMEYLFSRLKSIGKDTGSTARLLMWQYVIKTFLNNPFGYGVGNSVKAINTVSATYIGEGNIHNLYFQMLLDIGIIGVIWYIGTIAIFVKNEIKNILKNPVVMYLITYFVLGLVQFRGGDALMFYFVGIYVIEKNQLINGGTYNEKNNKKAII